MWSGPGGAAAGGEPTAGCCTAAPATLLLPEAAAGGRAATPHARSAAALGGMLLHPGCWHDLQQGQEQGLALLSPPASPAARVCNGRPVAGRPALAGATLQAGHLPLHSEQAGACCRQSNWIWAKVREVHPGH